MQNAVLSKFMIWRMMILKNGSLTLFEQATIESVRSVVNFEIVYAISVEEGKHVVVIQSEGNILIDLTFFSFKASFNFPVRFITISSSYYYSLMCFHVSIQIAIFLL